jgi:large subunit ribosomal protein L21
MMVNRLTTSLGSGFAEIMTPLGVTCTAIARNSLMTYAIVETGGKQLRVEPGRFYDVNRLAVSEDDTITLDKVLLVSHDDDTHVGQPMVEGAEVSATVMRHLRGPKLIVYKMQPKKKTRKKRGHRQELTRIMVDTIAVKGNVLAGEAAASAAAPVTKVDTPAAATEEE